MFNTKYILFIYCVFLSLTSNAQLLGFTYTDTNGANVEKYSNQLQNPSTQLTILVTAGLSRTVSYTLFKDGILFDTAESGSITVQDRFTFKGDDYYGKALTTNNILTSGNYTLTYVLKDHLGVVLSSNDETFVIDLTPPMFGEIYAHAVYNAVGGYAEIFKLGTGNSSISYFKVEGVSDDNGIKRAYYKLYREDGTLYREEDSPYDQINSQVIQNYEHIFPTSDLDEAFTYAMFFEDNAGNLSQTPIKTIYYDNRSPSVPIFGVYDPESNSTLAPGLLGFEPYVSGMTVKTNPVKLAFKINKHDWHAYREGGLEVYNSLGPAEIVSSDENNIYLTLQAPYGNTNHNYIRFRNFGAWGGPGISYNLKLAESAPKTPLWSKLEYLTDKFGWIPANAVKYINNQDLPAVITSVKFHAQERTYEQKAKHSSASCIIPSGSTYCEAPIYYLLPKGATSYIHGSFQIFSMGISTPELFGNPIWAELTYNDLHYPEITDTSFDIDKKELTVFIHQPGAGSYFDRLRLANTWIEYDVNTLPYKSIERSGYSNYEIIFDYTQLPAGLVNLTLFAKENHGPTSTLDLGTFNNDKQKPIISLKDDGVNGFTEIAGLEKILLTIIDDSAITIDNITLSGGPAADVINMASIQQSPTEYSLEYPRIFPALTENEKYTISISVTDDFLNVSSLTHSFTYRPLDLINIGNIDTLSINNGLLLPNNKPISVIETEVLRDEVGNIAQGLQTLYITLRSDADFPIIVSGVTVNPGETKEVLINIDDSNGKLYLPVYPAIKDVKGSAPFMVTMPAITFKKTITEPIPW